MDAGMVIRIIPPPPRGGGGGHNKTMMTVLNLNNDTQAVNETTIIHEPNACI